MRKSLFVIGLFILLCACNDAPKTDAVTSNIAELDKAQWPKLATADATASEILNAWPEYTAFVNTLNGLYALENNEELKLLLEDLIEKQKALEASVYPLVFDKPHIKSRQNVVKTFILKTKGLLEYHLNPDEGVVATINAYNALQKQFKVLANNTLDAKLILEGIEEETATDLPILK